ncbi:porin family protein [Polaribacter uvawellassae]|uniref:porin family protein n=1 Tax=Polaribacter uvawellassae TaxID=3133495 RepID=UPI00321ACCB1
MKKLFSILLMLISFCLYAQKDSLNLGDKYLEDQLYVNISYNQLFNQPSNVIGSGFSYGLNTGYIKDISLVKSGRVALGIGIGYAFDSFNHGYKITKPSNTVIVDVDPSVVGTSGLKLHSLEFPFEIRWRTSNANKYKFWRIYTGFKISYNLKNTLEYTSNSVLIEYDNIERFNKVQYGLTVAAGYSTFNFSLYYGLSPLLKSSILGTNPIDTKVLKLGLIFYIL